MADYVLRVAPVAKPRMTRADRWKQRPAVLRYWRFCDALRAEAARMGFTPQDCGVSLLFCIPVPPSLSRASKQRRIGQPHRGKPDKDNLEKAVWDALLGDDAGIWHTGAVAKVWTHEGEGRIEICVDAPDLSRFGLRADAQREAA